MSKMNRPPMSIAQLKKHIDKTDGGEAKIAVVVGSVTDDVRLYDVPKMTICALRFTNTARARITKAGGECLTFDQLALRAPTGENTMLLRGCKSHREVAKHFGAPGACRAAATAASWRGARRLLCTWPPGRCDVRLVEAQALPHHTRAACDPRRPMTRLCARTRAELWPHALASRVAKPTPASRFVTLTAVRSSCPHHRRAAVKRQAERQGEGPQVREGSWPPCVAWLPRLSLDPCLVPFYRCFSLFGAGRSED